MELQRHTGPLLRFDVTSDARTLSIRATNVFLEPDIEAFLVEEAFGSFMKIGRSLVGPAFQPKGVDLSYPPPAYAEQYARVFPCPVRFEQEQNLFSCDAALGNRPIATHDPLAHRQTLEFLQDALPPEPEGTEFLESIERIMRRDLRHAPSLAAIAAQLCMSERTLRRRLADQGVSYQTVIDTIRRKRAFTLLSNPRLSIEDVAHEVGFSDAHNFRRAFKRWTGHGPRGATHGAVTGVVSTETGGGTAPLPHHPIGGPAHASLRVANPAHQHHQLLAQPPAALVLIGAAMPVAEVFETRHLERQFENPRRIALQQPQRRRQREIAAHRDQRRDHVVLHAHLDRAAQLSRVSSASTCPLPLRRLDTWMCPIAR